MVVFWISEKNNTKVAILHDIFESGYLGVFSGVIISSLYKTDHQCDW